MNQNTQGYKIKAPSKQCSDKNCPFHGTAKLRGRMFRGAVLKNKMSKTAVVEWERRRYVPKYERYEKRTSRLSVHNPECINAQKGDIVKMVETRPLSKTKHFIIVEIEGKETKKEALKEEPELPEQKGKPEEQPESKDNKKKQEPEQKEEKGKQDKKK